MSVNRGLKKTGQSLPSSGMRKSALEVMLRFVIIAYLNPTINSPAVLLTARWVISKACFFAGPNPSISKKKIMIFIGL